MTWILLTLWCLSGLALIYVGWRHESVFRYRTQVLERVYHYNMRRVETEWEPGEGIPSLLSRNDVLPYSSREMLRQFWVWPLSKFHVCARDRAGECVICSDEVKEVFGSGVSTKI